MRKIKLKQSLTSMGPCTQPMHAEVEEEGDVCESKDMAHKISMTHKPGCRDWIFRFESAGGMSLSTKKLF